MLKFTGTKTVLARPMTRGVYTAYRGWAAPEAEDQATNGYLVEYTDGGKANDPRHEGYISWSPADVFEAAYKQHPTKTADGRDLAPHQVRVVMEAEELATKLEALSTFVGAFGTVTKVGEEEFARLHAQGSYMAGYLGVPRRRIAAF
jgi:hypothetical protein